MSNKLKSILISTLMVAVMVFGVSIIYQTGNTEIAGAINSEITSGMNATSAGTSTPTDANVVIKNVTNIMFFIIGAVSVIMLIYGGIRYTTSGGNTNSVTAAKNTVIYSIVGLVISILAYAIVNFVVTNIK
ncbi:hypothetical protein KBE99_00075 [Candidatus Saccharibacteria bacterium]|nr:hypothetical protein [Candidatus Saccharibacteria bacterium]